MQCKRTCILSCTLLSVLFLSFQPKKEKKTKLYEVCDNTTVEIIHGIDERNERTVQFFEYSVSETASYPAHSGFRLFIEFPAKKGKENEAKAKVCDYTTILTSSRRHPPRVDSTLHRD